MVGRWEERGSAARASAPLTDAIFAVWELKSQGLFGIFWWRGGRGLGLGLGWVGHLVVNVWWECGGVKGWGGSE